MMIARLYRMNAPDGGEHALREALTALADQVRSVPGCEGVELLQDCAVPHSFTFIEKWASVEAHKDGAAHLPKAAFGPVMAALASPPDGAYLDYLLTA